AGRAGPAVRDLPRQRQAARGERREIDGNVGPRRGAHAERLALAARQRQLVDLALVLEPLAARGAPDDLDRLTHPPQGAVEADAVPALDHLRPADAEAQTEAPMRHPR